MKPGLRFQHKGGKKNRRPSVMNRLTRKQNEQRRQHKECRTYDLQAAAGPPHHLMWSVRAERLLYNYFAEHMTSMQN